MHKHTQTHTHVCVCVYTYAYRGPLRGQKCFDCCIIFNNLTYVPSLLHLLGHSKALLHFF